MIQFLDYLEKDMLFADVVEITSSRKETRVSDSPILTYVISEKDLESAASIDFYQSLQTIIPPSPAVVIFLFA